MSKRWLGNAAAITDVWTVSLSGTVTSQTYTFTINAKSISYTSTGSDTPNTIFSAFVTMWNLSANPPEFLELTATALPSGGPYTSLTLTQTRAGVPSVISVATSGAATFSIANTTVATGPNFFDNTQNWQGGVAPVNSDTLIFDSGSASCLYNINTSLTGIMLNVNPGYSGYLGLASINSTGQTSYAEYRTTNLTFAGGTAVLSSPTCSQCNLAFGSNTTNVRVLATGNRLNPYIPPVLITGGNGSSELDATKGDIGVAFYQGQTANFPVIKTGYQTNAATDVTLTLGVGCTLGAITKNGGILSIAANVTTLVQDVQGGSVTLLNAVTCTTLTVNAGTAVISTIGTIGTVNLYGSAILDADQDPRSRTITNPIQVFSPNVTVKDNQKAINAGTLTISANGCQTINLQHGSNSTMVLT